MPDHRTVEILYDDQCPVCRGYCSKVELSDTGDKLELVDARKQGALMDEVTAQGMDIDEGMVVKVDGKLYYGSEAMRELVKISKAGWLQRRLFHSRGISAVVYNFCKSVRNVLLRALGIRKIENLKGLRYRS